MPPHNDTDRAYEPPALEVLGTVADLTLVDKKYGESDGFTFQGVSITNASP
ncbi:MAG TPA: lasso RiPP family leader peptide-containing protein [Baekduia sp.]|uniref:lasso RiPP family leader peptide-containing protein n=1 Tax=Baekduia sp. TaxID=2600305 RepID=UPI002C7D7C73|nr:lasso RiPP family leader peptide-containing protein [Baekduia sp.]HMJ34010.1 lasso RiPP family leader peptide-containing protein [Baekduia sp.]